VPAASSTTWSPRANGTACALNRVCAAGACASQCFIAGVLHAALAVNSDNACEQCDPETSTTSWSARADGTSCAANEVCQAGQCQARCFIDGAFLQPGELNPVNPCEQCNPTASTTAWSARSEGSSCAAGKVCTAGACAEGCFIGGTHFAPNAPNAANSCEVCEPAQSVSAFSPRPDGSACGAGQLCGAGTCAPRCFVNGVLHAENALNPQNVCEQCVPASATTGWSARAVGTSCGSGQVCDATPACAAKCFIGGVIYPSDAVSPATACEQCKPASSTMAWTPRATVPLLVGGTDIASQGWLTASQMPATVTAGADFTRLATSTNSGASTSGQVLIYKTGVVDAGVPFTITAELQVESVSPHNSLDSGAAILGAFTPGFGTSVQRSQMVFLDAAAIGWADDTQSAPLVVTNGQYRTYVFSVDAANTARLSVDGVPMLTRSNFVSNGTIAFGDQTNDANVDGVMRIRSISRVCP
jgi:tetrahydromethanopterin S-methyltransferase subunit D